MNLCPPNSKVLQEKRQRHQQKRILQQQRGMGAGVANRSNSTNRGSDDSDDGSDDDGGGIGMAGGGSGRLGRGVWVRVVRTSPPTSLLVETQVDPVTVAGDSCCSNSSSRSPIKSPNRSGSGMYRWKFNRTYVCSRNVCMMLWRW